LLLEHEKKKAAALHIAKELDRFQECSTLTKAKEKYCNF
jgi:hypothetical protein